MKLIDTKKEDFYNPSGYADYLENKYYHHSDKGCQIEMDIEYGNRPGEVSVPGIIKRCITHNCVCSKTGWEKGWYKGTDSLINYCECGKELEGKNRLCYDCKIKHAEESKLKFIEKRKNLSNFIKKLKAENKAKLANNR